MLFVAAVDFDLLSEYEALSKTNTEGNSGAVSLRIQVLFGKVLKVVSESSVQSLCLPNFLVFF